MKNIQPLVQELRTFSISVIANNNVSSIYYRTIGVTQAALLRQSSNNFLS